MENPFNKGGNKATLDADLNDTAVTKGNFSANGSAPPCKPVRAAARSVKIIHDPYAQLKALEFGGNDMGARCRWKMQGTLEEIPVMFFFVLKELQVLKVRSALRCIGSMCVRPATVQPAMSSVLMLLIIGCGVFAAPRSEKGPKGDPC